MKKLQFILLCLIFVSACSVSDDTIQNDESTGQPDKEETDDAATIDNDPDKESVVDTEAYDTDIIKESDTVPDFDEIETVDDDDSEEIPDEDLTGKNILIEQIYFAGVSMGEAILIIGPDGTSVLIDAANDSMTTQIVEAIMRRTGKKEIDWVIITHYHNDHIGGFDNLFGNDSKEGVKINKGIVLRGMLDIGSDMPGVEDFNEFCTLISGELSSYVVNLCSGTQMPCGGGSGGPWSAENCDGLLKGDLSTTDDDSSGLTSFIDLGSGAKIFFTHANGWISSNGGSTSAEKNGITIGWGNTDEENARSLGGVLKWGNFRYVFAGDTQGRDIKIEKFIADNSSKTLIHGTDPLVSSTGGDAVHLSHHGLASSTSAEWIDWLFPNDGKSRNAIVGTTGIYVTSPAQSVLDGLAPRLGTGMVWANAKAWTSGTSPKLFVANAAVTVNVENGGNNYKIVTGIEPNIFSSEIFTSTGN
ncbi:MAG TPA: MBL fold metallo-hydrolase [bacterium]|nr:MBL fold metallo-hydrolase [bacterium]